MRKAENPEPDSLLDGPQDAEATGALPISLTTFIGRERELDELRSLFREGKRLVTLVGIGGIGKTRLALELGFSASDLGRSKVYLVELASLANPDLVEGAVLESVGGGSSRSPLKAVAEYLRDTTVLLVLDCCEHVLDAAPQSSAWPTGPSWPGSPPTTHRTANSAESHIHLGNVRPASCQSA